MLVLSSDSGKRRALRGMSNCAFPAEQPVNQKGTASKVASRRKTNTWANIRAFAGLLFLMS
jgi:hypothetical protein